MVSNGRRVCASGAQSSSAYALMLALLVSMVAARSPVQAAFDGTIETYVGGGNGDGADAIDAMIDPRGLILVSDPSGADAYIADGRNNRVRRVDGATGIIQTVAGNGTRGFSGDGGQAQNAALALPLDVALDAAGNLYISDYDNNRIRKVTPGGVISTLAGNGNLSYSGDGGLATQAALYNPWGVAVGPDGYVYIADSGNNRIRKVGPPGCGPQSCVISTAIGSGAWGFAGDGGAAAGATLRTPSDVAFDSVGNMLIADWGNHRIRRVAGGIINTIAGGGTVGPTGGVGDGGPAVGAVLRYPAQVTVDGAGIVYITDTQQRRVRMVQNGTITTLAGTGTAGDGGDGGAAVNADMYPPYGVAIQAGVVWIATTTDLAKSQHNRVRRVDAARTIVSVVGGGLGDGGAAVDALVDPRGAAAIPGGGPLPDLYFADGNNNVVRYVDGSDGTIYVLAGTGEAGYSGDGGPATNARLRIPLDVAVDRTGNVYIADTSNNAVRRVDGNGTHHHRRRHRHARLSPATAGRRRRRSSPAPTAWPSMATATSSLPTTTTTASARWPEWRDQDGGGQRRGELRRRRRRRDGGQPAQPVGRGGCQRRHALHRRHLQLSHSPGRPERDHQHLRRHRGERVRRRRRRCHAGEDRYPLVAHPRRRQQPVHRRHEQ